MRVRRVRAGVDTDTLTLLERFGSQMLATARRYSANSQDAEDAFQQASEILLSHEPSGSDDDVCRWLRTTVKHEALAIRRRQDRVLPSGPPERVPVDGVNPADTEQQAERLERLRQGAQALGRLKPQEVRCLRLRAEGYSYREIGELTGWSYTKVNRCLTEGRQAFFQRLAAIEAGAECERMRAALSAVADGEAGAADVAALRPHLRDCPACRARLRGYRAVPARVAALVPAPVLACAAPSRFRTLLESTLGAAQDRVAALAERAHHGAELAAGPKIAAVAASAALAGGGGVAAERMAAAPDPHTAKSHRAARAAAPQRVEARPARAAPAPAPTPRPDPAPVAPPPAPIAVAPAPAPSSPQPAPAPAEFTPAAAPPPTPPVAPASASRGGGEFAP